MNDVARKNGKANGRDAVARGLEAYDDLRHRADDWHVRAESAEHAALIAEAEVDRLSKELHKVKAQRDHFMRHAAALKGKLEGFVHLQKSGAAMLDDALKMTENQSYGNEPAVEPEMPRKAIMEMPLPTFLRQGPAE
jgi:hypothetical protein